MRGWRLVAVAAVIAGLGGCMAPGGGRTTPAKLAAEATLYTHPTLGFSLRQPPGSKAIEPKDGGGDVIFESPQGYALSIQSGRTDAKAGFRDLAGRLEERYLGPNKRWNQKLGERTIEMVGRPAYDALYEGSGTRARVVIWRGPDRDFVFMFVAPPEVFDASGDHFDLVLDSFRPGGENAANAARPAAGGRRFQAADLGYGFDYPPDWSVTRTGPYAVAATGRDGSSGPAPTVTLQNINPGPGSAPAGVAANLKSQLKSGAGQVQFLYDAAYVYARGPVRAEGVQFVAGFELQGRRYRQWTVIVPRPTGTATHVWSYTAAETRFDEFRGVAETILGSWQMQGADLPR